MIKIEELISQVLKVTWNHYEKMIQWVEKTQDLKDKPKHVDMFRGIQETWDGEFCPCCDAFHEATDNAECEECPLRNYKKPFPRYCCNGLWDKMNHANTWKKWLKYAKKIQRFIEKRDKKLGKR